MAVWTVVVVVVAAAAGVLTYRYVPSSARRPAKEKSTGECG